MMFLSRELMPGEWRIINRLLLFLCYTVFDGRREAESIVDKGDENCA